MGCKNSTEKKSEGDEPAKAKERQKASTPAPAADDDGVDNDPLFVFLVGVYPQYAEHTQRSLSDPTIRGLINKAFVNTSLEFAKHVYHVKTDTAAKTIRRAVSKCLRDNTKIDGVELKELEDNNKWITERRTDDVQYQLLVQWHSAVSKKQTKNRSSNDGSGPTSPTTANPANNNGAASSSSAAEKDNNSPFRAALSLEEAQTVLKHLCGGVNPEGGFQFPTAKKPDAIRFSELCDVFFAKFGTQEMKDLFRKHSEGANQMNARQLFEFLGADHTTEELAEDTIRSSFGGVLCEYNFTAHFLNPAMNGILDPKRASHVWQDMTLPLPNYHIRSAVVISEEQLTEALGAGVRGLLLNTLIIRLEKRNRPKPRSTPGSSSNGARSDGASTANTTPLNSPTKNNERPLPEMEEVEEKVLYVTETLSLKRVAELIKSHGFRTSSYPIILGLLPAGANLSVELQTLAAQELSEQLDDRLAKGLMFDGATLTDPRFSPSALQEKVLILASQATLCPFVGVYVSDMQRHGLGVRVTDVKDASPAASAGITKDDWFTHVNGAAVEDKDRFKEILSKAQIGDELVMRKENLTEVRVIIGGAVPPTSPNHAQALSTRTFLTAHSADKDPHTPWSTSIHNSLEDVHATKDDFALVRLNATPDKQRDEKDVSSADELGVQFIFSESSAADLWARGKFAENGDSGFNLRFNEEEWKPSRWRLSLVAPPPAASGQKPTRCTCGVFGKDRTECDSQEIVFDARPVQAVCLFTLEYEGGKVFEASLPSALLRTGHRAVVLIEPATGRSTSCMVYAELLEVAV